MQTLQLEFASFGSSRKQPARPTNEQGLLSELASFAEFGKPTQRLAFDPQIPGRVLEPIPVFINEFWTARQREASKLHEVSYRACFKPQLPRFFIERLTQPGGVVYDPFMGRGTTLLEAALLGRVPCGCDVNPLSICLTRPRLNPPTTQAVAARLKNIPWSEKCDAPEELLVFYHPATLQEICALKKYLQDRTTRDQLDWVDDWIRLVALNRLTGHSAGFFSVYTLPPNQAASVKSQARINERRKQTPPLRSVPGIILKKTRQLLADCTPVVRERLAAVAPKARMFIQAAQEPSPLPDGSVDLVVTSPPFLDVVQYAADNWLRCWFAGIDADKVKITTPKKIEQWAETMTAVFRELSRALKPGGHVAFEVGEIHGGKTRLEETVVPCGAAAGLQPILILINDQAFTKTANCWGVQNNSKGTNTNRIVLFRKGSGSVAEPGQRG